MRTFSLTVMSGNRLLSCGTKQMPRRRIWSARSPASGSPLNATRPRRAGRRPQITRRSVRLAGAVRADDAIAAIGSMRSDSPVQDVGTGAVAGGDVLDLEERHQAAPR